MKNIISSLFPYALAPLLFGLVAFGFLGCDRDEEPFDGPNLVDRFGDFTVIEAFQASRTTVDFAAGETVIFSAEFNINVDWVIEITGLESGSVRRIEGFDRVISATNATWSGGTTFLPLFKAEACAITLSVPEQPDYLDSANVEIIGTKIYEGSLFTDFENSLGSNLFFGNFEFELTNASGRVNTVPAGQGDFSYFLKGNDNVVPNFFVGLINIESDVTGQTYAPLPTTVPANLFFNCFLYSDGGDFGIAVIQFVFDTNNSGNFEDGVDQTFQLPGDYPINFTGFRHIHHSMADVGMTQAQLEKLVCIRVLLISDMNSQPNPSIDVDFGIDYLTFTQGQPLRL